MAKCHRTLLLTSGIAANYCRSSIGSRIMKIQTLASMVSSTCVLWCFLPMAVYGCSIHDQLCTFHALGAPHTSYDVKNASTSLNIYAQAENPSAGAARTDFDNNVLLPTNTAISDAISPTVIRPTGPYTAAQTSYLQNGHLPAIWSDSSTLPVHVYPSQYQVTFNQNTAQANHTGDLNGGENGNIPNAMGCPSRESNPDCEAVVITGNVPSGIYSQKIEMFNFYNVSNPSAVMTVGAYATGQGVLIQQSHVDDATAQLGGLPRQLVDLQTTNGKPSNVTSAVNSSFYLAGSKATSQQFDYHFYNRGFDSHAQGTLSFDQKMYHNRGMSQAYQVANHQTGNLDIYRSSLYSIDTKTTTIGAQGESVVSVRNGLVRAGQAQLVGVEVQRGCVETSFGCFNRGFLESNKKLRDEIILAEYFAMGNGNTINKGSSNTGSGLSSLKLANNIMTHSAFGAEQWSKDVLNGQLNQLIDNRYTRKFQIAELSKFTIHDLDGNFKKEATNILNPTGKSDALYVERARKIMDTPGVNATAKYTPIVGYVADGIDVGVYVVEHEKNKPSTYIVPGLVWLGGKAFEGGGAIAGAAVGVGGFGVGAIPGAITGGVAGHVAFETIVKDSYTKGLEMTIGSWANTTGDMMNDVLKSVP